MHSNDMFLPSIIGKKNCWYYTTITECPICGCGDEIRDRRYIAKPDNPNDRYKFEVVYDWV